MCFNCLLNINTRPEYDFKKDIEKFINEFPNQLVKAFLESINRLHKIESIEYPPPRYAFDKNGYLKSTETEMGIEPYQEGLFQYKVTYTIEYFSKAKIRKENRIYLFNE